MAKISEVFDLQMGKTPARANEEYWIDGANKWVSIGDLSGYEKYVEDTKEKITDLAVAESGIKAVPSDTVIMSFKLSLGKVAITKTPVYTNEAIMAFLPKHGQSILPDYFYHYFSSIDWSKGTNRAVMGVTLNKATLGEMEIQIPSMVKQVEIADRLNKIDELISLRKQQLAKLDELVKARFVELFGDVASNPNGYPIKDFDEISILITDGEHATPRRTTEGIYLLSARNVLNHALQLENVDYIDEEEYGRIARRIVPQAGDVLISCSGSIGRCCVVPKGLKFQMVRSAALIRFNETINPVFAEWLITSDDLQSQIAQSVTQSSQANLFQGKIKKLHGFVPPIELQNQLAAFVEQTDKSKLAVQQSLDKLETLQKFLMQKYFG